MKNYFVLDYKSDGKGCPYFLAGDYSPPEWEFTGDELDPHQVEITEKYSLALTDQETDKLDFDYYAEEPTIVSRSFVDLCQASEVPFRAVPIEVTLHTGQPSTKDYFIYLPAAHVALLDLEKSTVEIEKIVETGEDMIDKLYPPNLVYAKIDHFVPKETTTPELFFCIELIGLVCTEKFKIAATEKNIIGLDFTPVDADFRYDPWG